MARVMFTGLEASEVETLGGSAGTWEVSSAIKRTGGYSFRSYPTTTGNGYVYIYSFDPASGAIVAYDVVTGYYRFYFYIATLPAAGSEEFFTIIDSVLAAKLTLRVTSTGKIQAYSNNGADQIGSDGATSLSTETWQRIQVKCGTGPSAAYEIKIGDVTELSGTANLRNTNNGGCIIGKVNNRNGQSVDFYYDDISIDDAEYPGEGAILRLDPDSNGTYTAWEIQGGVGEKWQMVDEIPRDDGATCLRSTQTIGDALTVGLESCASAGVPSGASIKSVCSYIWVSRGGFPPGVKLRIHSGSTNLDTATAIVADASWTLYGLLSNVDPDTSAAWTISGVDGAEIGCIEASVDARTYWTTGYLMVDYSPVVGMGQVI